MKRLTNFLIFGLLLGLFASSTLAKRKIRFANVKKEKPLRDIEIAWQKPTRTQAQTWILWGWNQQGYMVTAFLISTRFLLVNRVGVQLTIRTPKGKVHHFVKEYKLSSVVSKKKRMFLRVAKKHLWDGGLRAGTVRIDYGKWGCRLKYKRVLQGYRHMRGPMRFGSSIFEGLTFAPRLRLQGTLRMNGKKINFRGLGYADYSLQTITPKRLAQRWYAARAMDKEFTVLAHQLRTIKSWKPGSLPGFSIARGKRWQFVSLPRHIKYFRAYHVKEDKKAGYKVPWRVVYKAKADDGTRYKLDVKHTQQIVRLDLLSHVNPVIRFFIRRLLSNPFVFRFKALFKLEIRSPGGAVLRKTLRGFTEWLFVQ